MSQTIDARGLSCPQPVVLTSKAIAAADLVTVIVDNAVAVENVTRLARSKGFAVEKSEKPDGIYLALHREGQPVVSAEEPLISCTPSQGTASPIVVFVPADCLGRGPAELGERLMGAFFHTLLEVGPKPKTIIFMNTGVKVAVEGSRALDDLRALAAQGIDILACGTCLSFFELTDKLAVGRVSNMYDIATALLEAGKVVEL
ncbi:MAG: sulfurtransferase-like selenium metabolism protein YedF [Proteobacteria bacterium]|jgi:selenium metabolism protein YedF|nr:sulfurtransferase-like selenium metabolism protein YedF [Pseudomonadota bacterium]